MAATVALLGSSSFNTTTGTKTGTGTPAVGSLILIASLQTGITTSVNPTDDRSGTYTRVASALKASSGDLMELWVRDALVASAVLHTVTHAEGVSSGGGFMLMEVTGMTRVGSAAVRQVATQANQGAGTPAPVFGAAPLTANAIVGLVGNATNPATMTAPSGFTELYDNGYAVPATGLEVARVNSGVTATTITWGSASASAFASIVAELDISAASLKVARYYYDMSGAMANV